MLTEPLNMRLVIECLRCERACRDLAAELTNPNDKRALELLQSLPAGPERTREALSLEVMLGQAMIAGRGYAAPEPADLPQPVDKLSLLVHIGFFLLIVGGVFLVAVIS